MKFKSIQFSVAALAGASVLVVVVALVLYALFAGSRTEALVQERTQALLEKVINERLIALANTQASKIQRELEYALTTARELASTNMLMAQTDATGSPQLNVSREELSNLVKQALERNPKLLDFYIGWEPNAFDGNDDLYKGQTDAGYDATGRFMPWWYRKPDGTPVVAALTAAQMESTKLTPTGVAEGEYYQCPKRSKKECVIDPAPYEFNGKMVLTA
ncbi:MAG: chemotaxis protein, partial [Pseudomonas sp. PGPPP3]